MLDRIAELEEEDSEEQSKPTQPEQPAAAATLDDQSAHAFEFQIDELRKALADARTERDALGKRAARAGELEKEIAAARQESEGDVAPRVQPVDLDDNAGHAREVTELEQRLKERGQLVTSLRAQLQEAERVGRELVQRLVHSEGTSQNDSALAAEAAATDAELSAQLDALLQKCTRHEANLEAASWKIASLTATLDDQKAETTDQVMLEDALRHAHEQLSELKKQLADRS